MKIEQRSTDELIPYIANTKEHPKDQIDQIVESIKTFGFNDPIAIDEKSVIIEGHGRLLAAKEIGMSEVPVIVLSHLTDEQKRAYILTHNKLTMNTGFDRDMLISELSSLFEAGFDLSLTGFDDAEIEDFGIGVESIEVDYDLANDVPTVDQDQIVIEQGDIIQLGKHTLLCGDATDENEIEKLLSTARDGTRRHFISDPPYGIKYDPGIEKYGMIKNDDTFLDFMEIAEKYTDGFLMIWTSYQVVDEWIKRIKKRFGKITNMIIWHKGGGGMGDCARTLATDYEIALANHRGNPIQSSRGGSVWLYQDQEKSEFIKKAKKDQLKEMLLSLSDRGSLWRVKKDNTAQYLHPTQKPVEINEKALENFTRSGDIVVDLFLGSGSNLIACENMNRICFGMELDAKYAQTIIERWCQYTSVDTITINNIEVSWNEYKNK